MATCPSCERALPDDGRFCHHCGAPLESTSAETRTRLPGAVTGARDAARPDAGVTPSRSHPSLDDARFLPGSMVAGRYRIVGLLGRGGMGEVYRADDLKLGQPVALKFLPREVQRSVDRLRRFLDEVRLALRITHPNVCRVYDIGEVEGQHYISMEYVDGEDLASLLRRIGRLPQDRGVTVARQICAGLAAAHAQGILHRDLKPANIMIDGRGRARITDFGLAGFAGGDGGTGDSSVGARSDDRSGTPAYMAPEQLAGAPASERSDIYSLGLVLYEIFSGKPAFETAATLEAIRRQRGTTPGSLSSHVQGIDPSIEAAILRALDPEPARRPASVLALAAALPGGNPLAAALAAGETPSPEMVAAAATEVGLRRPVAIACLAAGLAGLLLTAFSMPRQDLLALVPWKLSPTELSVRAQSILRELGGPDRPRVVRDGLVADDEYLDWIRDNNGSMSRWVRLADPRPAAVRYWMRASPAPLTPADIHAFFVSLDDPPEDRAGGFTVQLDTEGRLVGFRARWARPTPGEGVDQESGSRGAEVSIDRLFELAGLDRFIMRPVDPVMAPLAPGDDLRAWSDSVETGATSVSPLESIVQIGRLGGRVSSFQIIHPWDSPPGSSSPSDSGFTLSISIVFAVAISLAIALARANLKSGSGDRQGAFRLVMFFVAIGFGSWLCLDVRLSDLNPGKLFHELVFGRVLGHMLVHAALVWLFYIALEPYVRKLWPETLISWTRLLIGGIRDPLVGRDLLIGAMTGSLLIAFETMLAPWLRGVFGVPPAQPNVIRSMFLGGPIPTGQVELAGLLITSQSAIGASMLMLLVFLLLRLATRRNWAAAIVFISLFGIVAQLNYPEAGTARLIHIAFFMLFVSLYVVCLLRFGLLSGLSFFFFYHLTQEPLTPDATAWYAGGSFTVLAVSAGLMIWGFGAAIGRHGRYERIAAGISAPQ